MRSMAQSLRKARNRRFKKLLKDAQTNGDVGVSPDFRFQKSMELIYLRSPVVPQGAKAPLRFAKKAGERVRHEAFTVVDARISAVCSRGAVRCAHGCRKDFRRL